MKHTSLLLWTYFKHKHLYRFASKEHLNTWQEKKIKRHMKKMVLDSPFYKAYYEGFSLNDWKSLPVIDKNIMMANFNELNTQGIDREMAFELALKSEISRNFKPTIGKVTIGLSSGTSGSRGLFVASEKESAIWAGAILAKLLPKGLLEKERIAFFLRANSNLYESVQSKHIQFKFFDLLDSLDKHIQGLDQFMPSIIVAPPSMLSMIAAALNQQQLHIKPMKVIAVAEVLDLETKNELTHAFNQTIHQVYQATEGFIAATCPHGTLHINEDVLYVQKEYIDRDSGRFIPVITDFTRTSQPILRYRLNDILIEKNEPCPCGSTFMAIEAIEGRSDDIFYGIEKQRDARISIFPDFIRRAVLVGAKDVLEYKVTQQSLTEIHISLLTQQDAHNETIQRALVKAFENLFERLGCEMPEIIFLPYETELRGNKLRRIVRRFSLE